MTINLHKPEEPQTSAAAPARQNIAPRAGNAPADIDGSAEETIDAPEGDAEASSASPSGVPRRRALAFPDLRPYLVVKGGGKAVARGTVIIVRWTIGASSGRPSPPGRPAEKDKPTGQATAVRKGQKERVSVDVVLAMVFVSACVALTAARYLFYAIGFVVTVFLPAAYLLGAWAEEGTRGEDGRRPGPPKPDAARTPDPDNVVDPPESREATGQNDRDAQRAEDSADAAPEPTEEERQVALYEWVRGMIGKRNGVHVRTLLDDLNRERERVGLGEASMADLRAFLEGRGIPVQDQVKVGKHNRSGVKRADVPESFTPLPGPDGHAVRLLPRLPPPDLQ
ncbi:hypothetical protein [Streptomyces anulatus]|uniref:hypothetical protein n=1 Tax=Streptomyces anulatus TaxID=1892 RepID=UPI001C2751BF|nr:hypothetical protein [Streptomyces anulatus]